MLIRKAYKFRLEPTADQVARLAVLCAHARFVWSNGLRHCLSKLDDGEKIPSYAELCKLVTQWKKDDNLFWLKEAYTDKLFRGTVNSPIQLGAVNHVAKLNYLVERKSDLLCASSTIIRTTRSRYALCSRMYLTNTVRISSRTTTLTQLMEAAIPLGTKVPSILAVN